MGVISEGGGAGLSGGGVGIRAGQRCFRYDEERDVWVCWRGGELKRIGRVHKKGEVGYKR